MDTLTTLLYIYAIVLVANSLISGALWLFQRKTFFLIPFMLWVGLTINFLVQGPFQTLDIKMVLAFGTYLPCSILLAEFINMTNRQLFSSYRKRSLFVACTGFSLALYNHFSSFNFFWAALFVAIALAYPMLEASIRSLLNFRKNSFYENLFASLVFVNALHFLDYPILRQYKSGSLFGFSFALVLIFLFSILLPVYIIHLAELENVKNLEKTIGERTSDLKVANNDLAKANKALDVKNEALEEADKNNKILLSMVVHDIANPLSYAKWQIEKISRQAKKQSLTPELLNVCIGNMKESNEIIDEILSQVQKLQAFQLGKVKIELDPVNLLTCTHQALSIFEKQLLDKQIKITIEDKTNNKAIVLAEQKTLKNNVLLNLLSNAIKFTPVGGRIHIELDSIDNEVIFKITDTGIGIPKNIQDVLFEIGKPTTREGTEGERGTGFGLPLVKVCLNRFNASLCLKSIAKEETSGNESSGTTFTMRFSKAA